MKKEYYDPDLIIELFGDPEIVCTVRIGSEPGWGQDSFDDEEEM